jgi:L-iditol 2-dehydrogenase/L-gulonate 5-dehydrogenase
MKAIVLEAPRCAKIKELEAHPLEDGEVLVRNKALGICGSDIEIYQGHRVVKTPLVMGHEGTGVVVDVEKSVSSLSVGDHVVIEPNFYCGKCSYCRVGRMNLCSNKILLGVTHNGVFAEYVKVPEMYAWKLPTDLDFVKATLIEPLSVVVHALKNISVIPEDNVLVIGGGPIGALSAYYLREMGANVVIQEALSTRKTLLEKIGLRVAGVSDEGKNEINDLFDGKGAKLVIDTAGAKTTVIQAFEMLNPGGTIVIVGLTETTAELPVHQVVRKEINIRGSIIYVGEFAKAIELMKKKADLFGKVITHVFPFSDFGKALEVATKRESLKVVIKVD